MTIGTVSGLTTHAAGYDRQSQERENRSVASPIAQRAANHGEAQRRIKAGEDLIWVGHYSEAPGTSAFGKADRPEFTRLLHDCHAGKINMVIVNYVSRFSRLDPLEAIPVVTELLNLGVTIVSVTEGIFRKGNLMDLIHLIMRLDAAHNESKNKSTAVKSAHDLARELGGYVGKAGYGFRMVPETRYTEDGRPVVIQALRHEKPEADEIRRWWFDVIKPNMAVTFTPVRGRHHPGSLTNLARTLHSTGVPTVGATAGKRTADSAWDAATIKRILMDPRTAGFRTRPVYGDNVPKSGRRTITGYRIERDPVTMEPLTLGCGPIIPPDDWYELQQWLSTRGRGKGMTRGEYLLTGFGALKCEGGNPMVGHARQNKASGYQCKCRKGEHVGSVTITCDRLDGYIAHRIFALIQTAEGDEDTLGVIHAATQLFGRVNEKPELAGERASLLAERADSAKALEELYDDRAAGGYGGTIGRKKFLEQEARLSVKLDGAEERLRELAASMNPVLPLDQWLPEDGGDATGPGSWWAEADLASKRAFVQLFVESITVRKSKTGNKYDPIQERVTITWRSEDDDEEPEPVAA
ncbi:recombinase family protein [Streptomyces sp. NBC_00184]|uniref:recombinase family protein n=1 Tax=Streptomyces sp. NBC_00184 TaxID=2975673 RepID=UPI002E2B63C7|nr:recombinase family protein [Streptomyces sp. NBC_00184]